MSVIKVFSPDSIEYNRLAAAAAMMTAFSGGGIFYYVGKTYFDFGQDWKWTTILAEKKDSPLMSKSWQAIYPAMQEKIIFTNTPEDLAAVVSEYFQNSALDSMA